MVAAAYGSFSSQSLIHKVELELVADKTGRKESFVSKNCLQRNWMPFLHRVYVCLKSAAVFRVVSDDCYAGQYFIAMEM